MSARLEDAIVQAKQARGDLAWDEARASRVLAGAVRRHRTHRALRRGGVVVTGAALLVVALLRLAPAKAEATAAAATEPTPEPIASIAPIAIANEGVNVATGDAGYGRD